MSAIILEFGQVQQLNVIFVCVSHCVLHYSEVHYGFIIIGNGANVNKMVGMQSVNLISMFTPWTTPHH